MLSLIPHHHKPDHDMKRALLSLLHSRGNADFSHVSNEMKWKQDEKWERK